MEKFIGFKMVQAEEMTAEERKIYFPNIKPATEEKDGYKVVYPDGYESWSPKSVFKKAYMQVGQNNTITQENIDMFIASVQDFKLGEKTTTVMVTLVNGFVITESSSCVDPANFNQEIGKEICMEKVKDKIWGLLGFLLQTAVSGIK